jgi:hypothetical protein
MKPLRATLTAIFVIALPLGVQGQSLQWCTAVQAPSMASAPKTARAASCESTIAMQNRINRHIHREIVPKLKTCWDGLEGKGTVDAKFEYRRHGTRWVLANSSVRSSTLAESQEQLALRCLQQAVRDNSFAVVAADAETDEFHLNWSFPVPWPKDIAEAAQRMIDTGGGGGGCGGSENPPPACFDCGYLQVLPGLPGVSFCQKVCAGYLTCRHEPHGCNVGPISPQCATGSTFGNQGGVVLY